VSGPDRTRLPFRFVPACRLWYLPRQQSV